MFWETYNHEKLTLKQLQKCMFVLLDHQLIIRDDAVDIFMLLYIIILNVSIQYCKYIEVVGTDSFLLIIVTKIYLFHINTNVNKTL